MLLPLVYYGDRQLRASSQPILEITPEIRALVENMIETMDARHGIGLAAPQVGYLLRLFVLRNYIENAEGDLSVSEPRVYINPKLSQPSSETEIASEGCLSIPGIRGDVERPLSILVEATDLEGNRFEERVVGYNARVRMHENDHLNGVLFIDRMDPDSRRKLEPLLKQIIREHQK